MAEEVLKGEKDVEDIGEEANSGFEGMEALARAIELGTCHKTPPSPHTRTHLL